MESLFELLDFMWEVVMISNEHIDSGCIFAFA
jgi:hypothetical protein